MPKTLLSADGIDQARVCASNRGERSGVLSPGLRASRLTGRSLDLDTTRPQKIAQLPASGLPTGTSETFAITQSYKALCRAATAAIRFDLPSELAVAAESLYELAQNSGPSLPPAYRRALSKLIGRLLHGLSERNMDFCEAFDVRTNTLRAAHAFATLHKAQELTLEPRRVTPSRAESDLRHLSPETLRERAPLYRAALAFSSLENSIRAELYSDSVGVRHLKDCLPKLLQGLPADFQRGMTKLMIGLVAGFRTPIVHGWGRFSAEQLAALTKLLDRLHLFTKHPDEREHQACIDPIPAPPTQLFSLSGAHRSSSPICSKRPSSGVGEVQYGASLLAHSLKADASNIPPHLRMATQEILTLTQRLLAAPSAPSNTNQAAPPTTATGRRLFAYQRLEKLTYLALRKLPDGGRSAPLLSRMRIDYLFKRQDFCNALGLSPEQARGTSTLLQSFFMLYRNLPTHEQKYQSTHVGEIVEKLMLQVAERTLGAFVRPRGTPPAAATQLSESDFASSHPLLLQGCWKSMQAGDYQSVFKETSAIVSAARCSWTYTLETGLASQHMAVTHLENLLRSASGLFSYGVLSGPQDPKQRALEALALSSALLGYYCPESMAVTTRN